VVVVLKISDKMTFSADKIIVNREILHWGATIAVGGCMIIKDKD
jgi:hypothetical protein